VKKWHLIAFAVIIGLLAANGVKMEKIFGVFWIGFAILSLYLLFVIFKHHNQVKKNIVLIDDFLAQNRFVVTRKVGGKIDLWSGAPSYFLFVDDVNKQWFLTSPYLPEIGKIRKFDDLIDYDSFDNEGSDIEGEILRLYTTTVSIVGGLAIGASFGRNRVLNSLVGGTAGAIIGNKLGKIITGTQGVSSAFGLVLVTKDCTINNTNLIFDFCNAIRHSRARMSKAVSVINSFGKKANLGFKRSSYKYKSEFQAVKEMVEIFDYIYKNK